MIKPFRKENTGAYVKVMLILCIVAIFISSIYDMLVMGLSGLSLNTFILVLISVFSGMMIMFGASLLNLRKLLPAFEQMSEGKINVRLPRVWCPVLTSASEAASKLSNELNYRQIDIKGNNNG